MKTLEDILTHYCSAIIHTEIEEAEDYMARYMLIKPLNGNLIATGEIDTRGSFCLQEITHFRGFVELHIKKEGFKIIKMDRVHIGDKSKMIINVSNMLEKDV